MFDSCLCIEPDECGVLLSTKTRRAATEHVCEECGYTISPGDTYQVDAMVIEGTFETHKICRPCLAVRDSMFSCGWYYGMMWEDIHERYCYGEDEDGDDYCMCPDREES